MVCPMERLRVNRYLYESYREDWPLLTPRGFSNPERCQRKK